MSFWFDFFCWLCLYSGIFMEMFPIRSDFVGIITDLFQIASDLVVGYHGPDDDKGCPVLADRRRTILYSRMYFLLLR